MPALVAIDPLAFHLLPPHPYKQAKVLARAR
jgi:hypothetical protein